MRRKKARAPQPLAAGGSFSDGLHQRRSTSIVKRWSGAGGRPAVPCCGRNTRRRHPIRASRRRVRCWRPRRESNPRTRICSPLRNHSATWPQARKRPGERRRLAAEAPHNRASCERQRRSALSSPVPCAAAQGPRRSIAWARAGTRQAGRWKPCGRNGPGCSDMGGRMLAKPACVALLMASREGQGAGQGSLAAALSAAFSGNVVGIAQNDRFR